VEVRGRARDEEQEEHAEDPEELVARARRFVGSGGGWCAGRPMHDRCFERGDKCRRRDCRRIHDADLSSRLRHTGSDRVIEQRRSDGELRRAGTHGHEHLQVHFVTVVDKIGMADQVETD